MAETVTEKHKKPIENAWDLAGRGLKWGVGLLVAGLFAFGSGLGFYHATSLPRLPCAEVGMGVGLGLAIGLLGFAIPNLSRVKAFGEKLATSKNNEICQAWNAAQSNFKRVYAVVGISAYALGERLGGYIGKCVDAHKFVSLQMSGGDVALATGFCLLVGGIGAVLMKRGSEKLRTIQGASHKTELTP